MKLDDYSIIMPGRIVEYFPADQTATVKICNDTTTSNSTDDDIQTEKAHLYNVPVFTGGGGGWHITFPVKPDDTCLLNFSQFGYDHWLYKDADKAGVRAGGKAQPWTRRRFSLADGFAQVGWNNIPRAISDYQSADAEFRNVDRAQRVTLKDDGKIEVVTGSTKITLTKDGDVQVDTDTACTINCDTSVVNATTSADISTATASITATAGTTIKSPLTTVDGNLSVTGTSSLTGVVSALASVVTPLCTAGTVAAGAGAVTLSAAGASSTAPMTATEFTAGSISLTTHVHAGDGGTGSGPNTGPPL